MRSLRAFPGRTTARTASSSFRRRFPALWWALVRLACWRPVWGCGGWRGAGGLGWPFEGHRTGEAIGGEALGVQRLLVEQVAFAAHGIVMPVDNLTR